jgi:hypothetical protein
MKLKSTSILTVFALTATAFLAHGQEPNNNDPNRQRGGDRTRNFEEFRQRMAERLKASLKVSDEEWAVIQPLIEKVTAKQRDAAGSRFGGFGGPSRGPGGSPGGGNAPAPSTGGDPSRPERAGTAEREALRQALESEGTSPETIKAKLTAVREVQKKAAAELAAAREDLRKVLTVRQEAALVSAGILE